MDYSLPVSSVHGILQARVLQWVAIAFSMGIGYIPANLFLILSVMSLLFSLAQIDIGLSLQQPYSELSLVPGIGSSEKWVVCHTDPVQNA